MKAETVLVNARAVISFSYTELDDERAPHGMDWEQFKLLVDELEQKPTVLVDVIRESR